MNIKIFIIFLTLTILLEWVAQYLISKTVKDLNYFFLFSSIILYGLIGLCYYYCLKNYNNVGVVNGIWNVVSTLGVSFIVGYLILKDTFTTLQIIGFIVMAIGGILLIPFKSFNNETV